MAVCIQSRRGGPAVPRGHEVPRTPQSDRTRSRHGGSYRDESRRGSRTRTRFPHRGAHPGRAGNVRLGLTVRFVPIDDQDMVIGEDGSAVGVGDSLAVITDSSGEASVRWVLSRLAGGHGVKVTAADLKPVFFHALAAPGPAARIGYIPDLLGALKGTTLLIGFDTQDQFGNAVPHVPVEVTPLTNGSSVSSQPGESDDDAGFEFEFMLSPLQGFNMFEVRLKSYVDTFAFIGVDGQVDGPAPVGPSFEPGLSPPNISLVGGAVTDSILWLLIGLGRFQVVRTDTHDPQPVFGAIARLELDTDQDPSSGYLRVPACVGMDTAAVGIDAMVDFDQRVPIEIGYPDTITGAVLFGLAVPSTADRCEHAYVVWRTVPTMSRSQILFALPRGVLDDDDIFDVVGFAASPARVHGGVITDLFPDSAAWTFQGPDSYATGQSAPDFHPWHYLSTPVDLRTPGVLWTERPVRTRLRLNR